MIFVLMFGLSGVIKEVSEIGVIVLGDKNVVWVSCVDVELF